MGRVAVAYPRRIRLAAWKQVTANAAQLLSAAISIERSPLIGVPTTEWVGPGPPTEGLGPSYGGLSAY